MEPAGPLAPLQGVSDAMSSCHQSPAAPLSLRLASSLDPLADPESQRLPSGWRGIAHEEGSGDSAELLGLIERARQDPAAFGVLYRLHHAAIMRYLCRRTGDQHAGEDLAAEVFLAAWRALGRYRHTGAPFRAWLLRIATNAANRWARRHLRERRAVRTIAAQSKSQTSMGGSDCGSLDADAAQDAMLALDPKHQAVLTLFYLEQLCVEEVAEVLACPAGTVKSRLARGRDALRRELIRRGYRDD